ncbi:MAG TPA: type VI secretion system baseplate subunit TssE [Methylomirabilota bacterium]|jgi:type VI secretion system protein ImpF|nr:type VI secretion system baseplate subunit TssE [Methylomirabilota bacterium]
MARADEISIVPSILDRLLDDEPDAPYEPLPRRFQNVSQLKRSVARDLEALLNTRQEILAALPPEFTELNRALVTYGLPDFTSLNLLHQRDRNRIRWALEQAIALFEPRLKQTRVVLEDQRQNDRALRFRVEAVLHVEPASEPVTFDAVLRLNTQEYVVQGQS